MMKFCISLLVWALSPLALATTHIPNEELNIHTSRYGDRTVKAVFTDGHADGSIGIAFELEPLPFVYKNTANKDTIGYIGEGRSPWVYIPKQWADQMPTSIRQSIFQKTPLKTYQLIYLLNVDFRRNVTGKITVGDDEIAENRLHVFTKKPNEIESSTTALLDFFLRSLRNGDMKLLYEYYGNGFTNRTGYYSAWDRHIETLKSFNGPQSSWKNLKQTNVEQNWLDYGIGVSADQGFCSRHDTYEVDLDNGKGSQEKARLTCYSSQSHRHRVDCVSPNPYKDNFNCAIEIIDRWLYQIPR